MADRPAGSAQGYIDPNWPPPGGDGDATIIIYGYTPNFALCVLALVLFFILGLAHGWQLFKYRTWYFSTMMVGIVFELIGYISRTLSAKRNPYKVSYFVIQYFFIVVAPVFFAAAIYTVLSILIRATPDGAHHAPLRPKLILWIFITCDVIATVIQIVGAALIGVAYSNRRDPSTPNNILLAGLVFQAVTFLVFIILLGVFVWRARHVAFAAASRTFYTAFGVAVAFIYLRIAFRLAETAQGLEGELQSNEEYFGTLEFMPVVLALGLLAAWHPGRCVRRNVSGEERVVKEGEGRP
ncbi:Sphingoid long-chain base transporter RSB1-like protein 7 [Stagonosporopsis vannaccii]|nr:Sphingoid long-chain base transporter RSB1-like protein 7 [Stagonosporopsis vannaccii]